MHIYSIYTLSSYYLSQSLSVLHQLASRLQETPFRKSSSILMVMGEKIVAPSFKVDLDKPIAFQVGYLGEHYQEWVHQPIHGKGSPRFYDSDFWEFFSRTAWWAIPIIWLPVVCWFISSSVRMGHKAPEIGLMIIGGMFLWTAVEYILHRFLFHLKTTSYWGNTIHYVLHGFHHKHPMDGLRLVFPPAATAVACIPLWSFAKFIATPSVAPALFGGGLLGYVIYDCTHYYLHYGQPTAGFPKNLKKDHLNHHFRAQDKGYGVTSALWDKVFGTLPPSKSYGKTSE